MLIEKRLKTIHGFFTEKVDINLVAINFGVGCNMDTQHKTMTSKQIKNRT